MNFINSLRTMRIKKGKLDKWDKAGIVAIIGMMAMIAYCGHLMGEQLYPCQASSEVTINASGYVIDELGIDGQSYEQHGDTVTITWDK